MRNSLEFHVEQLRWILGSWKSITIETAESFDNHETASNQYSGYEAAYRYIETADGRRLLEQRIEPEGPSDARITKFYRDGEKSAMLLGRPTGSHPQVTIQHAFGTEDRGQTSRPAPLAYLYHGLEPLSEVLQRATLLGRKRTSGRDCDVFLVPGREQDQAVGVRVYWLDQETSMPLRVEVFTNEEARSAGRPSLVWAAEAAEGVGIEALPRTHELTRYQSEQGNGRKVWFRVEGKVEAITLDVAYPQSTFWPEITPATSVNDLIGNRYIPASMDAVQPSASTTAEVANPIRAGDRPDATSIVPRVLLPLGVVLLAVALVLMRRRR